MGSLRFCNDCLAVVQFLIPSYALPALTHPSAQEAAIRRQEGTVRAEWGGRLIRT